LTSHHHQELCQNSGIVWGMYTLDDPKSCWEWAHCPFMSWYWPATTIQEHNKRTNRILTMIIKGKLTTLSKWNDAWNTFIHIGELLEQEERQ
jgi:hypothetical protein